METNEQYEEISLLDLLIIFVKQKWTIITTTLVFIALGFAWIFVIAKPIPLYKSELQAMMVAPYVVDQENFAIMISNNIMRAIVGSNAMKDSLIDEFKIGQMYDKSSKAKTRKDAYKLFEENLKVEQDKENNTTINISVKAKSPERAQAMADFVFKKTDAMLKEMAITAVDTVNKASDVLLEKEIQEKIASIDAKEDGRRGSAKVSELLGMYSAIMARDEGYRLKGKRPLALQLLSPASLPDSPEPQGRAKTLVLFTMLGFFLGLVLAFMKHVWSTVESEKKEEFFNAWHGKSMKN